MDRTRLLDGLNDFKEKAGAAREDWVL